MLLYAILMVIIGVVTYRKVAKLKQEMEAEKDEEIKQALAKSVRKRQLTANILIVLGVIFFFATILIFNVL